MKNLLLLFLAGCSTTVIPDFWQVDTIAAADARRLTYDNPSSHMKLEFMNLKGELASFLFLDGHQFSPAKMDSTFTEVSLVVDGVEYKERVPLREGKMRLKLSKNMTELLTKALQDQRQVVILTGGFKETFTTATFENAYDHMLNGKYRLTESIRGPLQ